MSKIKLVAFDLDGTIGDTEMITDLKQSGIIVALITGKGSKSCDITLRQFGMNTLFDKVLTGNEERNIKADLLK